MDRDGVWALLRRACPQVMLVARRETHGHVTSSLVWALVIFAAIMAALGTRLGLQELQARRTIYADVLAQRDADRARSGHQALGQQVEPGLRIARAPAPIAAVVRGFDAAIPQVWDFGPAGRREGRPFAEQDSSGVIDLEFIIRVVLGLLGIILAVGAVADDRASGTLLAVLSQPMWPGVVLAGKYVGGLVTLGASLILVTGTVFIVVAIGDPASFTSAFVASTIGVAAAGWLYLVVCFAFGALVSCLVTSHRAALASSLVAWLAAGAVGIAMPQLIARASAPAPPAFMQEQRFERIVQERLLQSQMAMGDTLLSIFPPGSDWRRVESTPDERNRALETLEPMWATHVADTQGVMEEAIERRNALLARQQRIVWALGMLSPGSQFTMAATSLSATGQAEYQRWNVAANDYEKALNRLLFHNPSRLTLLVAAQPPSPVGRTGRWIVSLSRRPPVRLETLPAFVAPHTRFAQRLRDGLSSLLVLGGLAVALVWATSMAFHRLRL